MANVAELIRESRQENRTVTVYPETAAEAIQILEDLGPEAADDCPTWDHQSGSGYSGPESVGYYDVWGDDWRVSVVTAEVTP